MRLSLFLIALAASAQDAARSPISGTVVNSLTGEPVRRALVSAICFPKNLAGNSAGPQTTRAIGGGVPQNVAVLSDDLGVFRFAALPEGGCRLSAQKAGFTPTGGSNVVDGRASVADARLSLDPLGVITGKVTGDDGAPVYGATVLVITTRIEDGVRTAYLDRTVRTDDRGVYRVWNLRPGKYYVKTAGRRAANIVYSSDAGPLGVFPESFAPTYVGGGMQLASAAPVVIGKGTRTEANIAVVWRPAFKITGIIENATPREPVEFELSADGEEFTPSAVTVHGDTGRFEILDVLPGNYLVRARQREAWAHRTLIVAGNVNGLTVQLAAPVDIPIAQRVSNPDALHTDEPQQPFCSATLHELGYPPSDRSLPSVRRSEVDDDGAAMLKGVPAGTYRVTVGCGGAYVLSAMAGTQDLLANPVLSLAPGAPAPAIEIVSRIGGGSVSVSLPPDVEETARVLLVPQFAAAAGPTFIGRTRTQDGLAPGPYLAYAFSPEAEVEYGNPDFVKSLHGGAPLQISEKAETKVSLTGVIE